MTDKRKKKIRDIQEQSGWSYMFCLHLVDFLGYGVVAEELDKLPPREGPDDPRWKALGNELNHRANEAAREEEKSYGH